MELREPPSSNRPRTSGGGSRWLPMVNLVLLVVLIGVALLGLWRPVGPTAVNAEEAGHAREVASKLMAAGALDEAASLYEDYLTKSGAEPESRAKVAYRLGTTYLDEGVYEKALRWFYDAETLGAGALSEELDRKIVHTLERLGRFHAAQATLRSRVRLEGGGESAAGGPTPEDGNDPVVARIGEDEFRRSDVDRALDDLPPQVAQNVVGQAPRQEFLRRFIADELLWRKARKLEYDQDPEVRRQQDRFVKQMAVARWIEQEVVGKIEVDADDLVTFFQANKERYEVQAGVRLRLIQVANLEEAREVEAEIRRGVSFAELAASRSKHQPTRAQGGLLDRWVVAGENFLGIDAPAPVSQAVFAAERGETTQPMESGGKVYVFRIEDKRPAQAPPFDEIRAVVERDYRLRKVETAYNETIEAELATEDVELFPERVGEG